LAKETDVGSGHFRALELKKIIRQLDWAFSGIVLGLTDFTPTSYDFHEFGAFTGKGDER
jgi:hypothetical protein